MHIERGLERLHAEFAGIFSVETVDRYVADSTQALSGSKIKEFVPLFVDRFAGERLRALAEAQGKIAKEVPEVLFVCVHNAGRSQMAACLLEHRAQGKVHVSSAGSTPADEINPAAVEAMAEIGLDLSQEFPKPVTDEITWAADVIVTMGCGDACAIYPGKRYMDWENLGDPSGKTVEEVRPIRDDIDRRVRALLSELVPTAPT